MSDGFMTGINIGATKGQIDTLVGVLKDAHKQFVEAFENFNKTLYDNWYAEKAAEFNINLKQLAEIKHTIAEFVNKLIEDVIAAAQTLASHNGASFSYSFTHLNGDNSFNNLETYKGNGTRGMNMKVITEAMEYLKNVANAVKGMINNAPTSISLYDKNGDLKARFQTRIKELGDIISGAIDAASDKVNQGVVEAMNNLATGKSNAQSSLEK